MFKKRDTTIHQLRARSCVYLAIALIACLLSCSQEGNRSREQGPASLTGQEQATTGNSVEEEEAGKPVCVLQNEDDVYVGIAAVGETATHSFLIHNAGQGPLVLEPRSRSCGCLTYADPGAIGPGEEAPLTLAVEIDKAEEKAVRATFATNDPDMPQLALTLRCRGVREVFAEPAQERFIVLQPGNTVTSELRIRTVSDETSFSVTNVRARAPWLRITDPASFPTATLSEHTIGIAVSPTKSGELSGAIIVETDSQKCPLVEVPVTALVSGLYEVLPAKLNFGTAEPDQWTSQTVTLRGRNGLRFAVLGVAVPDDRIRAVEAELSPTSTEPEFRNRRLLELACLPPRRLGPWRKTASVEVQSDTGIRTTLELICEGIVLPQALGKSSS